MRRSRARPRRPPPRKQQRRQSSTKASNRRAPPPAPPKTASKPTPTTTQAAPQGGGGSPFGGGLGSAVATGMAFGVGRYASNCQLFFRNFQKFLIFLGNCFLWRIVLLCFL